MPEGPWIVILREEASMFARNTVQRIVPMTGVNNSSWVENRIAFRF